MKKRHAFTLIEMLVVIAIIGIVAALVVGMNGAAQRAKKEAQVNGDKASLTTFITDYQSKLNFFPPDNGNLGSNNWGSSTIYDGWAATNPLLYELTGATNNTTNQTIQFFDGTSNTTQTVFNNMFGRSSVANANADEPHNFFQTGPQPKEYTNYDAVSGLKGLLSPVSLTSANGNPVTSFWHYDASSTNRHNLQSYDLWAEYTVGTKSGIPIVITNGNW